MEKPVKEFKILSESETRLSIIGESYIRENRKGVTRSYVMAKCECGNIKEYRLDRLSDGNTKSCGCYKHDLDVYRKLTHGDSVTALNKVWRGMKERCKIKNSDYYPRYSGRGIKVCDEWSNNYETFKQWALNNGWEKGLHIDRVNNDGNYEPSNCRIITCAENNLNKCNTVYITYKNQTKPVKEWANILGLEWKIIYARKVHNWKDVDLFLPPKTRRDSKTKEMIENIDFCIEINNLAKLSWAIDCPHSMN